MFVGPKNPRGNEEICQVSLVPQGLQLNLQGGHLIGNPLGQEPHLMGCILRKRKMMHQYVRNFVHDIYGPKNTCHHNNNKVLACKVLPFLLEIHFGLSMFMSELRYPLGEDDWELQCT
jgi:hypothetical protein